jgi:hypothetical protein
VRLSAKPFVFSEKLHGLCRPGAVAVRAIFGSGGDGIFAFAAARRLQSLWWNSAQETRFKLPGRNGAGDSYHRDAAALWE